MTLGHQSGPLEHHHGDKLGASPLCPLYPHAITLMRESGQGIEERERERRSTIELGDEPSHIGIRDMWAREY